METRNTPQELPGGNQDSRTDLVPQTGGQESVTVGSSQAAPQGQMKAASESKPTTSSPTVRRVVRKRSSSVWSELGALGIKIGIIIGVAVIIFTFVYGLHYNTDPSMHPAIKDGDLVMYYRWDKDYQVGDLLLLTFQGHTQVRRVVAVAGDTVNITDAGLVINGSVQQEGGIYFRTERYAVGVDLPITLGLGEVFVLGDYRDGAEDSRLYGAVKVQDTRGTVITVLRRRNL